MCCLFDQEENCYRGDNLDRASDISNLPKHSILSSLVGRFAVLDLGQAASDQDDLSAVGEGGDARCRVDHWPDVFHSSGHRIADYLGDCPCALPSSLAGPCNHSIVGIAPFFRCAGMLKQFLGPFSLNKAR